MDVMAFLPWVFTVAGVVLVFAGAKMLAGDARARGWPKLEGRIVGHQLRPSQEVGEADLHAAEIEYTPVAGGPPARLVDGIASNRREPIGTLVELRYDPADPAKVRRWRPVASGCLSGALLAIGTLCAVGGAFGIWLTLA